MKLRVEKGTTKQTYGQMSGTAPNQATRGFFGVGLNKGGIIDLDPKQVTEINTVELEGLSNKKIESILLEVRNELNQKIAELEKEKAKTGSLESEKQELLSLRSDYNEVKRVMQMLTAKNDKLTEDLKLAGTSKSELAKVHLQKVDLIRLLRIKLTKKKPTICFCRT